MARVYIGKVGIDRPSMIYSSVPLYFIGGSITVHVCHACKVEMVDTFIVTYHKIGSTIVLCPVLYKIIVPKAQGGLIEYYNFIQDIR